MTKAEAVPTSACVRKPAARLLLARSKPINPDSNIANANRAACSK